MVNKLKVLGLAYLILNIQSVFAQQKLTVGNGHSHNDYQQQIPLLKAYYAGLGSVEADVFLRNGDLCVAHEPKEIDAEKTLKNLYLQPLATFFKRNGQHPYPDAKKKLQLLIDIKEDYKTTLPVLLKQLEAYGQVFDQSINPDAIKIIITGNTPPATAFKNYPGILTFDGAPDIHYNAEELARISMISADLKKYSDWNGKGTPTPTDKKKLMNIIGQAHQVNKPFRFWDTKDSPNSWKELEKLGVDWIGTDSPDALGAYYKNQQKLEYINSGGYEVYKPTYASDGIAKKAKNIILLIGDGMGLAQIQAGLTANFGHLNLTAIKHIGFSRTEAVNSDFTDSAAGGTAMAVGEKTNNRYIGVDSMGKPLPALPDKLANLGIHSGIISSGDITDATPAAFYAHQLDRSMSAEIAADFLNSHVDVLVGSGRAHFTQKPNENLISRLTRKGFSLQKSLKDFVADSNPKQLVLLDDSATRKIIDGRGAMLQVSLAKTISLLSPGKKGFFIMAEGAQIDYGGHANDIAYVVTEQLDFDKLVGDALRFADKDGETLVIVTADHETGGLSLLDASYKHGQVRGNFSSDDHTNIMVPVFAYGPGASAFMGVYPNTDIFRKILDNFNKNNR